MIVRTTVLLLACLVLCEGQPGAGCTPQAVAYSPEGVREAQEDDMLIRGMHNYIRNSNCPSNNNLCLCAFNIEVFGVTKMSKPHVVEVLIDIIRLYDIVLIQEIRDASNTAIWDLLDQVNEGQSAANQFTNELSVRLGRSSSKEQYAYFYKGSKLRQDQTFQWPENTNDPDSVEDFYRHFERPPYSVKFTPIGSYQTGTFVFSGIHVRPSDAVYEVDYLHVAQGDIEAEMGTSNIVLGGDFNADCNYIRESDWDDIRLWTNRVPGSRYEWVITGRDTTLYASCCCYDRFVLSGSTLIQNWYQPNSANVFYFDTEYGLDDDHAREVSDHYPVEIILR